MKKNETTASKIGMTVFALLFGGMFTFGGLMFGIVPIIDQVSNARAADRYVSVPARVNAVQLDSSNDGEATTYRVEAEFSYSYDGRHYIGRQVNIGKGYDNLGDYHHRTFATLAKARDQGIPVPLWVDPAHPAVSVFDREIRWEVGIFHIPFMILFPGVGVWALWSIHRMWFRKAPPAPRLTVGTRLMPESSGAREVLLISIAWNLISFPAAALILPDLLKGRNQFAWFVMLFPIVGLCFVWAAIRLFIERRTIGEPRLILRGIAPLRGRIDFTPPLGLRQSPAKLRLEVQVQVMLVKDKGKSEDDEPTTLWEGTALDIRLPRGTTSLDFQSDVPAPDADDVGIEVHLKTSAANVVFKLPRAPVATTALATAAKSF